MNHPVLLVPHQEIYLQSWKNFPEIRWHMLVTGFGGGKTRANVILTLMLIRELQGLKDRAGDGARIIVAGYTLLHLERTFLLYFKSYLDSSKTEYRYDSKTHIFYIGTVTILLIPMETPENIFGEDCCIEGSQRVYTLRGMIPIKDVEVGDYVLTRKGFKQVLTKWLKGDKITYNYGGLICTPDHKIITEKGAEEICKAKNLYSLKEQNISGSEKLGEAQAVLSRLRKLFGLMSCGDGTKEVHTSYATEMEETTHYIMRSMQNLSETSQPDGMSITPMDTMTTGRKASSASARHSMQESITSKKTRLPFSSISTNSTCQKATTTILSHAQNVEKSTHLTDATAETNDALSAGSCSTEEMRWSILKESVLSFLQEFAKFVEKNFRGESDRTAALSADIDRIRCLTGTTSARTAEKLSSQKAVQNVSRGAQTARESLSVNSTMNTDIELLIEFVQSAEKLLEELLTKIVANSMAEEKVPEGSPAGIRTVYDIEVEDAHEFFAEGVLVHNCACIQEESDELPEATLMEACKALSERTRQQIIGFRSPFICLGTTSQGESGLYRLYCQFKKKGTGFVLIRGRTQDNFYLPKEQIIDLYKMYDDTERRVFLEGEFLAVSRNRVFPGFDWARNYMDDDFDKYLKPGERVFIGQDVNCIGGDVLIETLRGSVPMRDVTTDDMVLTRKGYKQVLTKLFKGVKIVREYGGVTATPDHVAITPEGDMAICQARNLFCLKEQFTSDLEPIRRMTALTSLLRWWLSMESSGEGTQVKKVQEGIIFTDTTQHYTDTYIRNLSDLYLKGCKSTTSMDTMTTDLKHLCSCLWQSTQRCIRNCRVDVMEGKPGRMQERLLRFWLIMLRKLEESTTQGQERRTGRMASSNAPLCALTAEKSSQQIYQLLRDALSVKKNTEGHLNGRTIITRRRELRHLIRTVLTEFVLSVENMLSEAVRQNIVRNTDIIGNVQGTHERNVEVFDIEVEGAHEFFANGVLVHNCGFSRATAWVAREGVMHCLKRYSFPDVADAPDVFRYDFPDQDIFWIPDVTTKDSYPQYARALRKNNIHIIHRSKNPIVEDTAFLVSVLCKNSRIVFHKMARDAADAVARAVRDKDGKIGKGKAPSDWQHDGDTVRYACSYMALVLPDFRDIRQSLITHIASLRREVEKDETPPVRKLAAGYTQIDPVAFFKK